MRTSHLHTGLGLLGLALPLAYWPGIAGAASAPRWWLVFIVTPLLLLLARLQWTTGHWLGAAFFVTCFVTPSTIPGATTIALVQLVAMGGAFCLGAALESTVPLWRGLALGLACNLPFMLAQGFGYNPLEAAPVGGAVGLFLNRDTFAELGAVVLVGLLMTSRGSWLLIGAAAAVALMPGSRTVYAALAVAAVLYGMRGASWRLAAPVAVGIVLTFTGFLAYETQDAQRLISLTNRIEAWDWATTNAKLFGWGYGTFGSILAAFGHAHNDFVELFFELGIGIVPFLALIIYALGAPLQGERLVLITLFLESCFSFPLHNPVTAFAAALLLGRLCAARSVVLHGRPASGAWHGPNFASAPAAAGNLR